VAQSLSQPGVIEFPTPGQERRRTVTVPDSFQSLQEYKRTWMAALTEEAGLRSVKIAALVHLHAATQDQTPFHHQCKQAPQHAQLPGCRFADNAARFHRALQRASPPQVQSMYDQLRLFTLHVVRLPTVLCVLHEC
jgi:hypothetical protein